MGNPRFQLKARRSRAELYAKQNQYKDEFGFLHGRTEQLLVAAEDLNLIRDSFQEGGFDLDKLPLLGGRMEKLIEEITLEHRKAELLLRTLTEEVCGELEEYRRIQNIQSDAIKRFENRQSMRNQLTAWFSGLALLISILALRGVRI